VTLAVTDGTGVSSTRFKVTVVEVNQPPTISGLTNEFIPSNQIGEFPFTVEDRETAASNLVVIATTLRPNFATVTVTGTETNRVLVFNPSGDQGQTFVTVTASDGQLTTTNTISVEVGAPYELIVSPIADQTVPEDLPATVAFTVSGSLTGNLVATGTASNTNLVSRITTAGSGTNWTATIGLVLDATGQSDITITASDEFGSGSTTFKLTVVETSDGPTLGPIPDQITSVGVPVQITLTVSDPDTAISNLVFTSSASNTNLVSGVTFANNGVTVVATVNVISNATGVSTVTITAADENVTSDSETFALTVSGAVNTPPTLAPIPPQTTRPGVAAVVPLVITDPDTSPATFILTWTASNTNIVRGVLFGQTSPSNFVATVNVRNNLGTSDVTIFVSDGRSQVSQTFLLTVAENPPVLGSIPDQTTSKNTPVSFPLVVTDLDTPLNELIFSSKTSNPGLVASVTFDTSTGTAIATITPVTNQIGAALMTISVSDSPNSTAQSSQLFALSVAEAVPAPVLDIVIATNPNGSKTVTVTWENGGELETADSVVGPWTKTGNSSGTFSEPATAATRFFRVAR
jgi:hypothetical protein